MRGIEHEVLVWYVMDAYLDIPTLKMAYLQRVFIQAQNKACSEFRTHLKCLCILVVIF